MVVQAPPPPSPPHQESKTLFANPSHRGKNHAAGHRGNEGEAWGTRFNSQNTCSSVIIPKEEEIQMRCCFLPSFLKTADEEKKSFGGCGNKKTQPGENSIWPPTMHHVGTGDRKRVHSRLKCVSVSFSISQSSRQQTELWPDSTFPENTKGILNWKKVVFIILTNKVRRAASTPNPSAAPPAFLHVQPPPPPPNSSQTPTWLFFTPFCASSLVPSLGFCRVTGSLKNKSILRRLKNELLTFPEIK